MASDDQRDVADVLPRRAGEPLYWLARMGLDAGQPRADTGIVKVTAYTLDGDGATLYDVIQDAAQGQRLCMVRGDQGSELKPEFHHVRSRCPRRSKGVHGAAQIESEPGSDGKEKARR
jgi:hypothetical protein